MKEKVSKKRRYKKRKKRERKGERIWGYLSGSWMGLLSGQDETMGHLISWRYRDTFILGDLKPWLYVWNLGDVFTKYLIELILTRWFSHHIELILCGPLYLFFLFLFFFWIFIWSANGLCMLLQGFRSFVWTAVSYQMKDMLKLSPAASQYVVSVAYSPWSIKPIYGWYNLLHLDNIYSIGYFVKWKSLLHVYWASNWDTRLTHNIQMELALISLTNNFESSDCDASLFWS